MTVPEITADTDSLRPMQFFCKFLTDRSSTALERRNQFLALPEEAREHLRDLTRLYNARVKTVVRLFH